MPFPSDDQRSVIEHRGSPLVVLAGPGSGKTATLVERIMQLLTENANAPVAFITFTRMSRRDTQMKLEARFGPDSAKQPDEAAFPRVSTLHTFAKSLVHRRAEMLGLHPDFVVLVPHREDDLILDDALLDLSITHGRNAAKEYLHARRYTDGPVYTFGLSAEHVQRLDERFEGLLRFYNAIDIPGLVIAARRIVETDPTAVGPLLLHIDEFQDLNRADQALVDCLITSGAQEVVVVGDDDQSIYGGRLANPQGIRDLMNREGWHQVIFRECHRLPSHVLRASQALLTLQAQPGFPKEIILPPDDGRRVAVYQCTALAVENTRVVREILRLVNQGDGTGRRYSFSDFMVLSPYRRGLRQLAILLEQQGVPVRLRQNTRIPDDLWLLLLVLRMVRADDNVALRQWLPQLGLSQEELATMRRAAEAHKQSLFAYARASIDCRLRTFLEQLETLRTHRGDASRLVETLQAACLAPVTDTLIQAITALTNESADAVPVRTLVRRLYEEYGLFDPEDDPADEDKVLLTTLHSAKGLESSVVFLVHMDDRFMPNPNRDPDEELRVLYVGVTRAKHDLQISFCERFQLSRRRRLREEAMSPFLLRILAHLNIVRWTAPLNR